MKRILMIGNPTAQSGKNAARIQQAIELFGLRGIDAELFPTLPGGQTVPAVAERVAEGRDSTLVAMGFSRRQCTPRVPSRCRKTAAAWASRSRPSMPAIPS